MGIAKQRGSYAERVTNAQSREAELAVAREANLKALGEMETKSNEQNANVIKYFVTEQLKAYDSQRDPVFSAMYRTDYSVIPREYLTYIG